ncbi:7016_t:CDS:2, partial [Entrophospora sp. SA101]
VGEPGANNNNSHVNFYLQLPVKHGRGRPKKVQFLNGNGVEINSGTNEPDANNNNSDTIDSLQSLVKRGRGRPKKHQDLNGINSDTNTHLLSSVKRRGRPKKEIFNGKDAEINPSISEPGANNDNNDDNAYLQSSVKRSRGRPKKVQFLNGNGIETNPGVDESGVNNNNSDTNGSLQSLVKRGHKNNTVPTGNGNRVGVSKKRKRGRPKKIDKINKKIQSTKVHRSNRQIKNKSADNNQSHQSNIPNKKPGLGRPRHQDKLENNHEEESKKYNIIKRGRGRPSNNNVISHTSQDHNKLITALENIDKNLKIDFSDQVEVPVKRGRGRPKRIGEEINNPAAQSSKKRKLNNTD